MIEVKLIRNKFLEDRTLGELYVNFKLCCYTLELPYKDNQDNISCIPYNTYDIKKIKSPKFKDVYQVLNVTERDHILFHVGNFITDTHGCILLGMSFNSKFDLVQSTGAFNMFMNRMDGQKGTLEIVRRG